MPMDVETVVRAAMKLHNLCIDYRLGTVSTFDHGILATDFTGATDDVCRHVGERLQQPSAFSGHMRSRCAGRIRALWRGASTLRGASVVDVFGHFEVDVRGLIKVVHRRMLM